ncbi:glycine cleavage H-protein-domain-containing protein [Bombardia bombarda]|uniref:Glycine cleavage H-protein-domain-containing protein n=1 Tax=Bombardia bombarda TaxID=252184 RepID=A0AA39XKQ1_9PEZI|nr:glycine cleavage H-protein-domain-containing protein [Bombardia bombarda]
MASIARCMRVARPLASLAKSSVSRPIARPFSVTSTNAIRKYTKEHEWIDLSADNKTGVIGISEYAAKALGDVVFVELPEEGKKVKAGDAIGAVESVKSAADINAPISCKITHVNLLLEEKPGTINQAGVADLEALMDAAAYEEFTTAEADH